MWMLLIFSLLEPAFAHAFFPVPRSGTSTTKKYIVKFKSSVKNSVSNDIQSALTFKPDYDYSMDGFRGFSGVLLDTELEVLKSTQQVEYIEEDGQVHKYSMVQQANATWGLARVSSQQPQSSTYTFDDSAGDGTCAYIIDTGIWTSHPEFENRATFLVDLSDEGSLIDGDGHGTHIAGTVGSRTWGIAKKTKLFAIKVLGSDGTGINSGVIAGFQYAVKDAINRTSACPKGYVANVSLGGTFKQSTNDAAAAMVKVGIFVAVASGNGYGDASRHSPASEPSVCTVGASAKNDTMAQFSNTGKLVDIIAPGVNITSTYLNNGIRAYSGTSMATPHITGLGAYLLSLGQVTPDKMCEAIQTLAMKDVLSGVPSDTKNLLAFNGATGGYGR